MTSHQEHHRPHHRRQLRHRRGERAGIRRGRRASDPGRAARERIQAAAEQLHAEFGIETLPLTLDVRDQAAVTRVLGNLPAALGGGGHPAEQCGTLARPGQAA